MLLLPAGLLACWLFRATRPAEYLAVVYGPEAPLLLHLPAVAACLCVVVALLARRRRGSSPAAPAQPVRRALQLAGLSALLLAVLLGAGFLRNLFALGAGVAVVAVATGIGLRLFSLPLLGLLRERFGGPLERSVLATAVGLGLLSLAVFVFGSAGLLSPWFWWPLIGLAGAGVWRPFRELVCDLRAAGQQFARSAHPVALASVLFTVIWCVIHLALLWAPPLEYDVLEYHLGSVAQYLRDGRISFLHENIYAAMPQNGEMLYLLGMVLGGGKYNGLPAAHLLLFAGWLLSLCGVYALVARIIEAAVPRPLPQGEGTLPLRAHFEQVAPALAVLLYVLIPLGTQMAADFYVEHFQALFHLGALWAACVFWSERRAGIRERFGWLLLAGLLAGLACGTKYSACLMTLLPLLILVPLLCAFGGSIYEALRAAACVAGPALALLAPWLVRNFVASGDPLYPLGLVLRRRLAGGGTVPDRLDHFDTALRAGSRSVAALGRALAQLWPGFSPRPEGQGLGFWLKDNECGPHLLLFALPGFLSRLRGEVILVAGFVILDVASWFLFTHRLNRFFFPALAPLAVLAGLGIARLWDAACSADAVGCPWYLALREQVAAVAVVVALVFGPLPLLHVWLLSQPAYMAGVEEPQQAARRQFESLGGASWFGAWEAINALPAGSKTLCLGDAQTFYLDHTPEYSVVFNRPLLGEVLAHAENAAAAAELLAAHGITHIYINYSEWFRLDSSYALTRDEPVGQASSLSDRQDAGPTWRYAWPGIDPARRRLLRQALYERRLAAYGEGWPEGDYPAYLKLTPSSYATLETLLKEFTSVVQTWPDQAGQPSCELRRLLCE